MDARSTTKLHAEWHETFTSQRILSLTVTFEMSLQIKWKENTVNRIVENQLQLKLEDMLVTCVISQTLSLHKKKQNLKSLAMTKGTFFQ